MKDSWEKGSCYVAGPMTGFAGFNFASFDVARDTLTAEGWTVVSPADMDRADGFDETGCTGNEKLTPEQYQRFAQNDLGALLRVDAVFALPGWEKSTGACNEVRVAHWLGIPVYAFAGRAQIVADSGFSGKTPTARGAMLAEAAGLVDGDRNDQYGDPRDDFRRTAAMWSAYLGCPVESHDVAALMSLLKVSRIRQSPAKRDSWVDLAGYAACGWDCARPE